MTIDRRTFVTGAAALSAAAAVNGGARAQDRDVPVIDVHTHMFSKGWMDIARKSSDPDFRLGTGEEDGALIYRGASMGTIVPAMIDYDIRIEAMDEAGVDTALISLTAPNVYWGTRAEAAQAARAVNDDFRAAAQKYDGRIRWMASLPWRNADDAIEELRRAQRNGAVGICMLTNVKGAPLTEDRFKPIWREIEATELPVFIHPTKPYVDYIGVEPWGLFNSIGFTNDTSLCFARMIHAGFFDEFPRLKPIASHGGGALPYLAARFDRIWEKGMPESARTENPPTSYLRQIHYDALVFDQDTLEFLIRKVGYDRVLYGSDYPFRIADMDGVLVRVNKLPPAERDAIKSGNIKKLYDL